MWHTTSHKLQEFPSSTLRSTARAHQRQHSLLLSFVIMFPVQLCILGPPTPDQPERCAIATECNLACNRFALALPLGHPCSRWCKRNMLFFVPVSKKSPNTRSIGWKSCAHAFETSLTSRKRECERPSGAVAIFLLLRVQSQQSKREATHTITHTNTTISWK